MTSLSDRHATAVSDAAFGHDVRQPDGEADPDELRSYLATEFAKWQLPDRIEFVEAIPRTATGKFKKTALRERFVGVAV